MKKYFGEGQVSPWSFYKNDHFDKQAINFDEEQQMHKHKIKRGTKSSAQLSANKQLDKKYLMKQKLAMLEKQGSPSQRILNRMMNDSDQTDNILSSRMARLVQPKFRKRGSQEKQKIQRKAMEKYTSIVNTPANLIEMMNFSENARNQTILLKILHENLRMQTYKETEMNRMETYEFLLPILGKKKAPQLPFIIRQKSPNTKKRASFDGQISHGQKIIDGIISKNIKERDKNYRQYLQQIKISQLK